MDHKASRALIAALFCIVALSACDGKNTAATGRPAPEIAASRLDGEPVRLADFEGRPVILYFWLGGCAACITELPTLREIRQRYPATQVAILPINVGGNAEVAEEFNRSSGGVFESTLDNLSLSATRFEVAVFPTTFVLDRDRVVRKKILGDLSLPALDRTLKPIL